MNLAQLCCIEIRTPKAFGAAFEERDPGIRRLPDQQSTRPNPQTPKAFASRRVLCRHGRCKAEDSLRLVRFSNASAKCASDCLRIPTQVQERDNRRYIGLDDEKHAKVSPPND